MKASLFCIKEYYLLCRYVQNSLSDKYIKKLLLSIIKKGSQPNLIDKRRIHIMDNNILSHTKYNCKYHIVFAPKFRRKESYGELKRERKYTKTTL